MRSYEDAKHNRDQFIDDAARRYVTGIQKTGLQPNRRLERAIAERTGQEAKRRYMEDMDAIQRHNIGSIMEAHKQRLNEIKRNGARLRWRTCPIIAAVFGLMAWYSYAHGHVDLVIVYALAALTFIAMLVLGAIFDRPVK